MKQTPMISEKALKELQKLYEPVPTSGEATSEEAEPADE